jgi:hypothetical protein
MPSYTQPNGPLAICFPSPLNVGVCDMSTRSPVASTTLGSEQVPSFLFDFFPRLFLTYSQGQISLDTFRQSTNESLRRVSCCEFHELDVMNVSKANTKVSEQYIRVAGDFEEDFWNRVRL